MNLENAFPVRLTKAQREYLKRVKDETGQSFNATIRTLINVEIKREKNGN